jgi:hypothetical protein
LSLAKLIEFWVKEREALTQFVFVSCILTPLESISRIALLRFKEWKKRKNFSRIALLRFKEWKKLRLNSTISRNSLRVSNSLMSDGYSWMRLVNAVALHGTYMFVLTCSFTVRSVCSRTSPVNAYVRISIKIRLEHSYSS